MDSKSDGSSLRGSGCCSWCHSGEVKHPRWQLRPRVGARPAALQVSGPGCSLAGEWSVPTDTPVQGDPAAHPHNPSSTHADGCPDQTGHREGPCQAASSLPQCPHHRPCPCALPNSAHLCPETCACPLRLHSQAAEQLPSSLREPSRGLQLSAECSLCYLCSSFAHLLPSQWKDVQNPCFLPFPSHLEHSWMLQGSIPSRTSCPAELFPAPLERKTAPRSQWLCWLSYPSRKRPCTPACGLGWWGHAGWGLSPG